jgi:hypothetical protein
MILYKKGGFLKKFFGNSQDKFSDMAGAGGGIDMSFKGRGPFAGKGSALRREKRQLKKLEKQGKLGEEGGDRLDYLRNVQKDRAKKIGATAALTAGAAFGASALAGGLGAGAGGGAGAAGAGAKGSSCSELRTTNPILSITTTISSSICICWSSCQPLCSQWDEGEKKTNQILIIFDSWLV